MLLGWVALMVPLVILSWRIHANRGEYDWAEYPTGLGDDRCYTSLGKQDFFEPNLKFAGHEGGLYRRNFKAVRREDADMVKLALESTGRFFVYTDEEPQERSKVASPRFYLKVADGEYLEFGERKYYPSADEALPKAIPVPWPSNQEGASQPLNGGVKPK